MVPEQVARSIWVLLQNGADFLCRLRLQCLQQQRASTFRHQGRWAEAARGCRRAWRPRRLWCPICDCHPGGSWGSYRRNNRSFCLMQPWGFVHRRIHSGHRIFRHLSLNDRHFWCWRGQHEVEAEDGVVHVDAVGGKNRRRGEAHYSAVGAAWSRCRG